MTDPEIFNNLLEVAAYLKQKKFKISKSTIYRHFNLGKIKPQPDGTFLKKDIDRYANIWLKLIGSEEPPQSIIDSTRTDKHEAEARKMAAQADHWELKAMILRGEYVERSAFESALAKRAAVFRADIENFIRSYAGEMISLVNGDALKAPDVIQFWLTKSEEWLARYSEDKEIELPKQVDFERLAKIEN